MGTEHDIYGGRDPRDVALYSVAEAAAFLRLPPSTLRTWVQGMSYSTQGGPKTTRPIIVRPRSKRGPQLLSFFNLVEAHVLALVRRHHRVQLESVRRAISFVKREMAVERPLLQQEFVTDGVSLFVESYGHLVNASSSGQIAMRELLEQGLKRIDRDPAGLAERLFPWINEVTEPRTIEIDPRRSFGRPTVLGTGIPSDVLADRFRAGDEISDLATDFGIDERQVSEAVRWELSVAAAA